MVSDGSRVSGVGGWLALLVFGLMVGGPLFNIVNTISEFADAERGLPQLLAMPSWQNAKIATWIFVIVQSGFLFSAGWKLSNQFVPASVSYAQATLWIAGPLFNVSCILVVAFLMHVPAAPGLPAAGQSVIYALVWTLYLQKSRRVRNTYLGSLVSLITEGPAEEQPTFKNRLMWKLTQNQRKTIFFSIVWIVLIMAYSLLFDAEYDGFFADGGDRDWGKIFIWAFVPPTLVSLGRWTYCRFVLSYSDIR